MEMKGYLKDFLNCIAKEINDSNAFAVKGDFALMTQAANRGVALNFSVQDLDLQILDKDKWGKFIETFNDMEHHSSLGVKYYLTSYDLRESKGKHVFSVNDSDLIAVYTDFDTKDYGYDRIKVGDVRVNCYTPNTMLADKLTAVALHKLYKRVKDIYDIYLLSTVFEFKLPKLVKNIKSKVDMDTSHIELYKPKNLDKLKSEYDKLSSVQPSAKPDFNEVYERVKYFTYPIYASLNEEGVNKIYWNKDEWVSKEEFMRNNFKKKSEEEC